MHSRAKGDLVSDRNRPEQLLAGRAGGFGDRQRSGYHVRARVPLDETMAVVEVERVREDTIRPCRPRGGELPSIEKRGCLIARVSRRRIVGGNLGRRRGAAGDGDGDEVA